MKELVDSVLRQTANEMPIEVLQTMLRLESSEDAREAADIIKMAAVYLERLPSVSESSEDNREAAVMIKVAAFIRQFRTEQQGNLTNTQRAKRTLGQISLHAKKLADLVWEHPLASDLMYMAFCGDPSQRYEHETAREHAAKFVPNLRGLSNLARYASSDGELFWLMHNRVLPKKTKRRSRVATELWPTLFLVWKRAGRKLSHTPNGPLHRFISYVHGIYNLAPPSPSTVRDAIRRFEAAGSASSISGLWRIRDKK